MNYLIKKYILVFVCVFLQVLVFVGTKYYYYINNQTVSLKYEVILLFIILFIMVVYAIIWQFVLKKIELSVANSIMSIVPLLTFCAGLILFNEEISKFNIVGFTMVITGLLMISNSNNKDNNETK